MTEELDKIVRTGDYLLVPSYHRITGPYFHRVGEASSHLKALHTLADRTYKQYLEKVGALEALLLAEETPTPSAEEVRLSEEIDELLFFRGYVLGQFSWEAQNEFPALRGRSNVGVARDWSVFWSLCPLAMLAVGAPEIGTPVADSHRPHLGLADERSILMN